MPDSIGHHRHCKAGREVKVSTVYLGGLAVSDKHGTVVTSANTTRTAHIHQRKISSLFISCHFFTVDVGKSPICSRVEITLMVKLINAHIF
jgi:hypothetical protein